MTNHPGPWGREEPPAPPRPRFGPPRIGRFGLWLLLMAGLAALVAALAHAFPGEVRDGEGWARVAYVAGVVALVSTGVFRAQRGAFAEHLRNIAIWSVILGLAALGFAYRDVFADAPQRLKLAFSDGSPVAAGERELVVPRDENGSYSVIATVNGQRVRFVVDTGASATVLSPDDARRVGVDVDALSFDRRSETANGVGASAVWVAPRLQLGPLAFDDFEMEVNQAPMSASLLGMSFLHRLDSFEFKGGALYLRFHDRPL